MIPLSRLAVLMIVGLISLVGLPLAFVGSESTLASPALSLPVLVGIELVVYFILTLAATPRITIAATFVLSLFLVAIRLCACLVAFWLAALLFEREITFLMAWGGDPVSAVLQIVVLMLLAPHAMDAINPELIDKETRRKLTGGETVAAARAPQATADSTPKGGFIQVFSYEELSAIIRKTQGLEGFIVYSNEGLIVWRDLPIKLDSDVLTAKMMTLSTDVGYLVTEGGLARMRQMMIETREHFVAVVELNANFGLILLYNSQTGLAECGQRIGILGKTTREFLQWKYPGLAVTASIQNRAALEAV